MNGFLKMKLSALLLSILGSGTAAADFNPSNPPEPNQIYKCNITVGATPDDKGYTSGTGRYLEGTKVTISTSSAAANWEFTGWLMNGVEDNTHKTKTFTYTVERVDVVFTAVYEYKEPEVVDPDDPETPVVPEFDPTNPAEPSYVEPIVPDDPEPPAVEDPKYALNLSMTPINSGSFSIDSGLTYKAGTEVTVIAYGNQGFVFLGWYEALTGTLLSPVTTVVYTIPENESTIVARWKYNPESPDDPGATGEQLDVDNSTGVNGDINGDDVADVADMQRLLNIMKGTYAPAATEHSGDINADGVVDVADMQRLLNIMKGL